MRALLGVSDRTGIVDFARELRSLGVDLIATDGTRAELASAGIDVTPVADVTGLAEMLDGRVKTLHPAIFAGILARRDSPDHLAQLTQHGYAPIDILAINLYPFTATLATGATEEQLIEKIDIGGPSLIRAAAKNRDSVAICVSPGQYPLVLADVRSGGAVGDGLRRRLAAEAFAHVAAYDTAVAGWLNRAGGDEGMPEALTVGGERIAELRYGENPHQRGAVYTLNGLPEGVAAAVQLQGPGLSFTNWLDVDSAWRLVSEFEEPAACIIKHTNPCGFAVGDDIASAYRSAYDCDPRAAFGGVVGVNRPLDAALVGALGKTFLEAVVAPSVTTDAAQMLSGRERLRLLAVGTPAPRAGLDVRSIGGGLLVQTEDRVSIDRATMRTATQRPPSESEWRDLLLAWRVCRHVKSNAIVIVSDGRAIGVGAGQMSRVEAAEIAVKRAGERCSGAVAASDAFFPMADGVEVLANAGITAIIQPGGSKKDDEVTTAGDGLGIAMIHAGERHFRH